MDEKQRRDSLLYCIRIVKERDYENYLNALLAPENTRPRIFAVLALNAEVAIIRQKIKRNSGVTGIYQLQFWKDALNVYGGAQRGPLPRQPVVSALKAYGDPADVPLLLKLVESRQETLGDRPFETMDKLEHNSDLVYGSMMFLWMNALKSVTAEVGNAEHEGISHAVHNMSRSVGILTLLRATLPLLHEGVVLLPLDIMAKHGLREEDIFSNAKPTVLRQLTQELCQNSYKYLLAARSKRREAIAKHLRPALVTYGQRSDYLLRILRKNGHNLFDTKLQERQSLISWRLLWSYGNSEEAQSYLSQSKEGAHEVVQRAG
uniref:Phytoene synthase n=1 Tax=Ditylenchus dipsaci TaxID=166011 RepID=A0A915E4Q6_9BILA